MGLEQTQFVQRSYWPYVLNLRNTVLGSTKRPLVSFPEILAGYILFVPKVGRNLEAHYIPWINMSGYKSVCKWVLENLCSTCDCLLAKGRMKGKMRFNPSQAPLENSLNTSLLTQGVALGILSGAPSLLSGFPAPDFRRCFPFQASISDMSNFMKRKPKRKKSSKAHHYADGNALAASTANRERNNGRCSSRQTNLG